MNASPTLSDYEISSIKAYQKIMIVQPFLKINLRHWEEVLRQRQQ